MDDKKLKIKFKISIPDISPSEPLTTDTENVKKKIKLKVVPIPDIHPSEPVTADTENVKKKIKLKVVPIPDIPPSEPVTADTENVKKKIKLKVVPIPDISNEPIDNVLKEKDTSDTKTIPKKRKRPDIAEKFKNRKNFKETVVKSCLLKYIYGDKELKSKIFEAINNRVESFSKRIYKTSLILSGIIKDLVDNVQDLSLIEFPNIFEQTFIRHIMVGIEDSKSEVSQLLVSYLKRHPEFVNDNLNRHLGDRNIYSAGVKKYITNLKNSLKMNFLERIKSSLKHIPKDQYIIMLYNIHGWSLKKDMETIKLSSENEDFIKESKKILNIQNETIDDRWFNKDTNLLKVIKFFVFLNRYKINNNLGKLFNIVPMSNIKPYFITLDTSCLYGILKEIKIIDCNYDTFIKNSMDHWKSIFKINSLEGQNNKFTGTIETDGISLCTHFMRPKNLCDESVIKITNKDRIIAIDPGRVNIFFGVEKKEDGTIIIYKLTRKQYYNESGVFKARKQVLTWNKDIQDSLDLMSLVSTKGISVIEHNKFITTYFQTSNILWNEMFKPRWRRQRLRLYGGKKRTFDRFFNKIKKSGDQTKRIIIAYGSAKFSPGGKGEISVPTGRAFHECKSRFPIKVVDEFRTTRIYYKDDSILQSVGFKGKSKDTVRGLLWCCSTNCSKFVNRDLNGALNILRCVDNRPKILTRQSCLSKLPKITGKWIKKCL